MAIEELTIGFEIFELISGSAKGTLWVPLARAVG